MVRKGGLEPPALAGPDPKSGASANSATFANIYFLLFNNLHRLCCPAVSQICRRCYQREGELACKRSFAYAPSKRTIAVVGSQSICVACYGLSGQVRPYCGDRPEIATATSGIMAFWIVILCTTGLKTETVGIAKNSRSGIVRTPGFNAGLPRHGLPCVLRSRKQVRH